MMILLLLFLAFIAGLMLGGLPLLFLWKKERERLRQDDFTGIPNYRSFLEHLQIRQHRMQCEKTSLGLILTDIDDFRQYNLKGYAFGDKVLKDFAQRLQAETAGLAFCARYRLGDEFVLLFSPEDQATLTDALQRMNLQKYGGEMIQFSYGLKVFSDPSLRDDQMLSEVQALLAQGKTKNKQK